MQDFHRTSLQQKRQRRTRAKIHGSADRPRLSVSRSNRFVYLQAIDDDAGKTLASVHQKSVKTKKSTKTEKAQAAAQTLVEKLKKQKIKKLVFDRGHFRYHGRVKAIADTLRDGGLEM